MNLGRRVAPRKVVSTGKNGQFTMMGTCNESVKRVVSTGKNGQFTMALQSAVVHAGVVSTGKNGQFTILGEVVERDARVVSTGKNGQFTMKVGVVRQFDLVVSTGKNGQFTIVDHVGDGQAKVVSTGKNGQFTIVAGNAVAHPEVVSTGKNGQYTMEGRNNLRAPLVVSTGKNGQVTIHQLLQLPAAGWFQREKMVNSQWPVAALHPCMGGFNGKKWSIHNRGRHGALLSQVVSTGKNGQLCQLWMMGSKIQSVGRKESSKALGNARFLRPDRPPDKAMGKCQRTWRTVAVQILARSPSRVKCSTGLLESRGI